MLFLINGAKWDKSVIFFRRNEEINFEVGHSGFLGIKRKYLKRLIHYFESRRFRLHNILVLKELLDPMKLKFDLNVEFLNDLIIFAPTEWNPNRHAGSVQRGAESSGVSHHSLSASRDFLRELWDFGT